MQKVGGYFKEVCEQYFQNQSIFLKSVRSTSILFDISAPEIQTMPR
jgi:hypothetical protein